MTDRPAGQLVIDHVSRCRRRLRLLAFVRHACLACATAVLVAAACALGLRVSSAIAAEWIGAGVGLGLAVAGLAAALRTPTRRATAAALDRRLHLQDRVVTALQLADDEDPIASLIVRDASHRLRAVVPARVFPLDLRFDWRVLLAPAAAALGVLLMLSWNETAAVPQAPAARGQGGAAGRPLATQPPSAEAARAEEVAAAPEGMAATAPDTERRAEPSAAATSQSRDARAAAANPAAGDARASKEGQSQRPSTGDDAETTSARTESTLAPSEPERVTSRSGGPQGASSPNSPEGVNAPASAGAPATPGRGGLAAAALAAGPAAGGVAGQSPQATDLARAELPARQPSYDVRYRAAWVKAQAALAQNRVPRSLRSYVRNYFEAIRPATAE